MPPSKVADAASAVVSADTLAVCSAAKAVSAEARAVTSEATAEDTSAVLLTDLQPSQDCVPGGTKVSFCSYLHWQQPKHLLHMRLRLLRSDEFVVLLSE